VKLVRSRDALRWARGLTIPTVAAIAGFVLLGGTALAIVVADINFEIEGNTEAGDQVPPGDDWESVILDAQPDGVFDDGPAILIKDPQGNGDPDIFSPSGKFATPANWTISSGNPGPAQNDLTNIGIYPVLPGDVGNTDTWMVLMMERTKSQGTFDLDFEFNQQAWDGASGTLVRTQGDVVAAFELKGNPEDPDADLVVQILVYDPSRNLFPNTSVGVADGDHCTVVTGNGGKLVSVSPFGTQACPNHDSTGFVVRVFAPAASAGDFDNDGIPDVVATMNGTAFDAPPWGSTDDHGAVRTTIPAFHFAEAAINLTELGLEPGCAGFGSVHAKSRSSLEPTADLKDLAGPVALNISCSLEGQKIKDTDSDGVFDASEPGIPNWPISLYLDDGDNVFDLPDDTLVATTVTCGDTVSCASGVADGTYRFAIATNGDYHVVEGDAPTGGDSSDWIHTGSRTTDGTTDGFTRIINITIDAANTASSGNDFLNAQPPDVTVDKTATNTPINAGELAEFVITVTNLGPGVAENVTLDDHLEAVANGWAINGTTGSPTCSILVVTADGTPTTGAPHNFTSDGEVQHLHCDLATLAKDATFSVTLQATTAAADCGTIPNTAVVDAANESEADNGNNEDSASIVVECPDIKASKSGSISYTASVTNDGAGDATGVVLSDQLPGDLSWSITSGTDTSKCSIDSSNLLTCNVGALASSASFSVTVDASISDAIEACSETPLIENTVSGSATNEAAGDATNNSDDVAICPPPSEE